MKRNLSFLAITFAILITMNAVTYIYILNLKESVKTSPLPIVGGNPYASDALYFRYPAKSLYINGHFFYPQSSNPNFESYIYGVRH